MNRITDEEIEKQIKKLQSEMAEAHEKLAGMHFAKRQAQDELLGPIAEGWSLRDMADLQLHILAAQTCDMEEFPFRGQVMHTSFACHLLDYLKIRHQERN